jgi:hypothetical protein
VPGHDISKNRPSGDLRAAGSCHKPPSGASRQVNPIVRIA